MASDFKAAARARQRTCDRCYRIKVRCAFTGDSAVCSRCRRLDHECTTIRAVLRPGPRAIGGARVGNTDLNKSPKLDGTSLGAVEVEESRQWTVEDGDLARSGWKTTSWELSSSLDPFSAAIRQFDRFELKVLEFMFDRSSFISKYVDGPLFEDPLLGALVRGLVSDPSVLKDSYLACAGAAVRRFCPSMAIEDTEMSLRRSARALRTLRAARPVSLAQLSTMLSLALGIITFAVQSVGRQTRHIVQAALRLVDPWSHGQVDHHWVTKDSNIVCLLFYDTTECLLRREKPVIRFQIPDMGAVVDRYFGMSHTILPILYDICGVGAEIKAMSNQGVEDLDPNWKSLALRLNEAWLRVDHWEGTLPYEVLGKLDTTEILHMTLQAHCFKLAAKMIVLHYLSSIPNTGLNLVLPAPFEPSDLGREIISALHTVSLKTRRTPRHCGFPYFLAAVELGMMDSEESILESANPDRSTYRSELLPRLRLYSNDTQSATCEALHEFAKFVWNFYDRRVASELGQRGKTKEFEVRTWLELVDYGPAFSVGL